MRKPQFIYFDLGKVIVDFDVDLMCRQIAEAAGIDSPTVFKILFDGKLQHRCELGEVNGTAFYEIFRDTAGHPIDRQALKHAASAIFELNLGVIPIIAGLSEAGHRLGILSNTSEAHWEYCRGRFRILGEAFGTYALSFRIGAMKPDAAIYQAAAKLAGVPPERIFYTDDIAGHIAGGKVAGFDAVQYVSPPQLAEELRRRGVEFNY
jgi:glucose-1-phosphatase